MPVAKKAMILIFVAFINFFGSMALALYVDQRYVLSAVLIPFLAGILLLTLKCERCGKRAYKNQVTVLGVTFTYWGGFLIPRTCTQCGFDLRASRRLNPRST